MNKKLEENTPLESWEEIKDLYLANGAVCEKCNPIQIREASNVFPLWDHVLNVERTLKEKVNLDSMCKNLAKLVGLKEKDYVELETLISNNLKALKVIVKTLKIRVSINKFGQCFIETDDCIFAISRSTYDLLKEVPLCHK